MRFGIKSLLLATVAVAMVCALIVSARNRYYSERLAAEQILREVQGISYDINSFTDIVEEVSDVNLSVDKHPGSQITLPGLGSYPSKDGFAVSRIGKWRFRTSGRSYSGAYNAATGEAVESDYSGGSILLGPDGPYKTVIPFKIHSLQDLVDHYQDLVELIESWPREAEPGQITLDNGSIQYFYVVDEGN